MPRDSVETNKIPNAITAAVLSVEMPVLSASLRSLWTMAGIVYYMPAPGTSGNRPLIRKVVTVVFLTRAMISL